MNTSELERRHIFRLFAAGNTPDQVAEILNRAKEDSADNQPGSILARISAHIDISDIKKLFREYFAMPISE
ncbi:MAG: hypothetical protein HY801_10575, partial [Candidatus Lindowbacteria bacterium]|nr:hypothetical protein [Candidatus Lindowbacteria bacterium]